MTQGTRSLTIALAGQPNCGKSTLFNLVTGAKQFVANYPGVTVDKSYGTCSIGDQKVTVVDLPGTYSFTSYSPEEKAAREFILHDLPDVVVAVVDASTLDKGLYFVLQLLEMRRPTIVALNMMDVARRRGFNIALDKLSEALGVPVIGLEAANGKGREELLELVQAEANKSSGDTEYNIAYKSIDIAIDELAKVIEKADASKQYPPRWLAIKVLDEDPAVIELLQANKDIFSHIEKLLVDIYAKTKEEFSKTPAQMISFERHAQARKFTKVAYQTTDTPENVEAEYTPSFTDCVDAVLCHRVLGPICLIAILFVFYQVSVTWGNELAAWVWPFWANTEIFIAGLLPLEGFLFDPFITFFTNWMVKSLTAIMNYLPIFLLMFAFVAILEGSGYLARIAFILDRIFNTFGLHGQSTLPLIIGGIYVGGCAIPGVVATRAIPDERARFATILIVPMMNCLAKVPLYLMLIGVFFAPTAGSTMFFMGTITLIMGLIVAKLLSLTLLRGYPPSPFIIELPSYHMPTLRNVVQETFNRVMMFIKKIITVVFVVSSIVFVLIYYPDVSSDRLEFYKAEQIKIENTFVKAIDSTSYKGKLTKDDIVPLIAYQTDLRNMKTGKTQEEAKAINAKELEKNPLYASVILRKGKDGKKMASALRKIDGQRKTLRREYRTERFEGSALGKAGKALEPATSGAGFTWRINVALLSALAAKENTAATLGALYGIDGSTTAESFAKQESSFTPLHALALMLFMALFPPCLAASMMVKAQTGATKWMIFSIVFQIVLGLGIATLVFSGGKALGFTGTEAMWWFYGLCVIIMIAVGMIPAHSPTSKSNISSLNNMSDDKKGEVYETITSPCACGGSCNSKSC